jgi:hypothetical protein
MSCIELERIKYMVRVNEAKKRYNWIRVDERYDQYKKNESVSRMKQTNENVD